MTASTALRPTTDPGRREATLAAGAGPAVLAPEPPPTTLPPIAELRIQEAELAEVADRVGEAWRASRSTNTPGSLVRPAAGSMTGWFGEGRRTHRHAGIDFDGDTGDPVTAAGAGVVTHAGSAPSAYAGYGQMVLIDHGNGVSTLYAHLSRIAVHSGATVESGDLVGAIGTTGSVTGSHLHFEVRIGGRPVNPSAWLAG